MTAPTAAGKAARPAQAKYLAHIEACPSWCDDCRRFARDADAEDGRRWGWEEGR